MAVITVRIDEELEARACKELERLGVSLAELMRQVLEYVAEHGRLPFELGAVVREEEQLVASVRERLADPQRVKVSLDDL